MCSSDLVYLDGNASGNALELPNGTTYDGPIGVDANGIFIKGSGGNAAVSVVYTVIGAYIFPTLALVLIVMNGRTAWVGAQLRNRWWTVLALAGVLVFFTWLAVANIETT